MATDNLEQYLDAAQEAARRGVVVRVSFASAIDAEFRSSKR